MTKVSAGNTIWLFALLPVIGVLSLPPLAVSDRIVAEVRWSAPVAVASAAAHRGPWRMNQSDFRFVDDPAVAMSGEYLALAWVNQAEKDVFLQLYGPGSHSIFEAPINVSRTPEVFSWLPVVVLEPNLGARPQQIYLLWQEIVFSGGGHGGEIFFSRSTDGGQSFAAPLNLSNSMAGDGKGRLSRDLWENGSLDLIRLPHGELIAAWTEYEGRLWVSRSADGGGSFSAPVHVAGNRVEPARGPALAASDEGTVFLAWAVGEDPEAKIRIAPSRDGAHTFEPPIEIGRDGQRADAPSLAVDPSGFLHLAYTQYSPGLVGREYVRYLRLQPSDLTIAKSSKVFGSSGFSRSAYPSIVSDGQQRLYLLWELFSLGSSRPRGLGFTVSLDGGQSFLDSQVVPHSDVEEHGHNGSSQGLLLDKLAVDRMGGIAVVNSTFRANNRSTVWLFRGQLIP
ncbi:MAG: sialidase family protein [Candidatus Competibacterales bacterium]